MNSDLTAPGGERKSSLIGFVGLLLSITLLTGCQRAATPSSDAASSWQPKWETIPDKSKKAKPQLSPTLAFTEDRLGWVPDLNTDEQKRLHEQDVQQKEAFIRAFRQVHECKSVIFMRTNPKPADFDMQMFNGLDGRMGKWQWVLYRTDITERLAFGEERDVDSVAKSICTALRANIEPTGGKVE